MAALAKRRLPKAVLSRRAVTRASIALSITLIASACTTALGGSTRDGRRGEAALEPAAPEPMSLRGPETTFLTALPPEATYAWVRPSTVFSGLSSSDDARVMTDALASFRSSGELVLRESGWRAAPIDSAQFRLAAVVVERTQQQVRYVEDPRNERAPRQRCPVALGTAKSTCVEPEARRKYPRIRTVEKFTEYKAGYAIVRVSDGASQWWIIDTASPADRDYYFAGKIRELLPPEAP